MRIEQIVHPQREPRALEETGIVARKPLLLFEVHEQSQVEGREVVEAEVVDLRSAGVIGRQARAETVVEQPALHRDIVPAYPAAAQCIAVEQVELRYAVRDDCVIFQFDRVIDRQVPAALAATGATRAPATPTATATAATRFVVRGWRIPRIAVLTARTTFAIGSGADARTKLVQPFGIDLAIWAREPFTHALGQGREVDRGRSCGIGRIPAGAQPYARSFHLFTVPCTLGAADTLARLGHTRRVDLAILAAQALLHPLRQLRDIGLTFG